METLIEKVSKASLEVALAVSAPSPHDKKPAVDVLDEEGDVVLTLQDAHSTVTSRRSWACFVYIAAYPRAALKPHS